MPAVARQCHKCHPLQGLFRLLSPKRRSNALAGAGKEAEAYSMSQTHQESETKINARLVRD